MLVATLAAVGQLDTAFDLLDDDEIFNLVFLLHAALLAATREREQRRRR